MQTYLGPRHIERLRMAPKKLTGDEARSLPLLLGARLEASGQKEESELPVEDVEGDLGKRGIG
jgi:hypothetical protein